MSLDSGDVKKIAFLSRLKLTPEEEDLYRRELSVIIDWFEKLGETDTEGVAPMLSPAEHVMALRADTVSEADERSALKNAAPAFKHGYYAVPKVIE